MPHVEHDLAIIGAGAGGLIAARFAAQLGARVLLAERDRIGGDCTWTGCVPSKSLIRVAKAAHEIRTAARFGISASPCKVDMPTVRDYVQQKVREIYEPTSPEALAGEGIDVALGAASFENERTLRVGSRSVTAQHCLICTGAVPLVPSIPGLSGTLYFTYHNIFDSAHLPASLIVIGGGPLGVELAQAFQRLGSQVMIVAPRLLSHDDPDAARVIERVFEREGVRLLRGRAASVRQEPSAVVSPSTTAVRRGRKACWWRPDANRMSMASGWIAPASCTQHMASQSTIGCEQTSRTFMPPAMSSAASSSHTSPVGRRLKPRATRCCPAAHRAAPTRSRGSRSLIRKSHRWD